jgi:O-acetyl-ADP-ribose deacetylase (regulator of RNase III)
MAKFSQNEGLKNKLLDTGDAYLIECAYHDAIWACGIRLNESERFDTSYWRGTNMLGFALMEVRDMLRNQSRMQWKEDKFESEDTLYNKTSKFTLINDSCADQEVDVVVNAANSRLWEGGGICGVIFSRAGSRELTEACSKYQTPLHDGDAVITPAFNMKNAKAIIHAVGPNFGVTPTAFKELFNAYYNSLVVMKDNGYHSIAFPLISSSIFGGNLLNPVAESTKQCMRAYKKFAEDYPDYDIDVKLCAFTDIEMKKAQQEYDEIVK